MDSYAQSCTRMYGYSVRPRCSPCQMPRQFWDQGVALQHRIVGEMEGGGYRAVGPFRDFARRRDKTWVPASWSPMGWGRARQR
eukprot:gene9205-biopygen6427